MSNRAAVKVRFGADSVTTADLPGDAAIYPAYVDGRYANVEAVRKRFPRALVPTITVTGREKADVVDQERGDATAPQAAAAVKGGIVSSIYCSVSELPAVCHALHALGIGPKVPIWTAHYTGTAHICTEKACWGRYGALPFTPLIIGTQYDDKGPHGQHYDRSEFVAYWPGVDPKPAHRSFTADETKGVEAAIAFFGGIAAHDVPLGKKAAELTHTLIEAARAAHAVK